MTTVQGMAPRRIYLKSIGSFLVKSVSLSEHLFGYISGISTIIVEPKYSSVDVYMIKNKIKKIKIKIKFKKNTKPQRKGSGRITERTAPQLHFEFKHSLNFIYVSQACNRDA